MDFSRGGSRVWGTGAWSDWLKWSNGRQPASPTPSPATSKTNIAQRK